MVPKYQRVHHDLTIELKKIILSDEKNHQHVAKST